MVNNSKILTVSYGTFSCTLEGFDDSFDTMKAIAEYFRDLAGEDRYFGAEPPQPDGEMLARIAERELSRGVTARTEGNRVMLQPTVQHTPEVEVEVAAEPEVISDLTPEVQVEPVATETLSPRKAKRAQKAAEELAATALAAKAAESAKDMVEDQSEEIEETPEINEVEEVSKVDAIKEAIEDIQEDTPQEAVIEDVEETEEQLEDDALETLEDDFEETNPDVASAPEEDAEPTPAPVADHDPDSIAAKLMRIQAVVGAGKIAAAADSYSEDEHAEDFSDAAAEDAAPEVAAQAMAEDVATRTPRARVLKMKRADFEAAVAQGQLEPTKEASQEEATVDEQDDTFDDLNESIFDDTAELDGLSELSEDDMGAPVEESVLSAEDEADLLRELAEAEEEATATSETETETENEGRVVLEEQVAKTDEAIDRIFEQTNVEMDEPAGKTRRDSIAQLKAAVAATEASRQMGEAVKAENEADPYKEDLAQVVRPRRAATPTAKRSERPAPPPLKLVASQRVNAHQPQGQPKPADASPVRPRRIAATPAQAAENDEGFTEFAQASGASNLSDMVEAAASFVTHVEGKDVFSRPQIMRKVAGALLDDYSREDGLRAFGTLLRQGKIEKIQGGQFRVTNTTGFRPETRAVG